MARGKYHEWLTENGLLRIESWASDGLTNNDISANMGIAVQTLDVWRKKYPSINESLKKGREPVVRKLENALIKNALGYEYEETTTEIWKDDDGNERRKAVKFKKYSKPESTALMFLLKNYKPEKYRNYNEITRRKIEAEAAKLEIDAKKVERELELLELESTADEDKVLFVDSSKEMEKWLDDNGSE